LSWPQETAINIGFACSLLRTEMAQYIVTAATREVLTLEDAGRFDEAAALAHASVREQLSDALRQIARSDSGASDVGNALIIDGKALDHALDDDIRDSLLAVRIPLAPDSLNGSHIPCWPVDRQ
jgi:magnesium-transporting ATPase (P-type)